MRKYIWRLLFVVVLLLLPVFAHNFYLWKIRLPDKITLATGPQGGQHRRIMEGLAKQIRQQLNVDVKLHETDGSLMNLKLLCEGEVDFALYQAGTQFYIAEEKARVKAPVNFVANLYSEVAHLVVRDDSKIVDPHQLVGKKVAVGKKLSGDFAMSLLLLQHLGISLEQIEPMYWDYSEIQKGFEDESIDAAFITVGIHADVLHRFANANQLRLLNLPFIPAATQNHISATPFQIPKGLYETREPVFPKENIETVALRSQLIVRDSVPDALVERVLAIAIGEEFLRSQQLGELFVEGNTFARQKPDFSMHPGASHFYDPELKPLINSNFVEGMEGMRSFIVSLLIAGWLVYRWWSRRSLRNTEHRLDSYIQSLLLIERKQLLLDETDHHEPEDARKLQKLLDDLTQLRQDALQNFTAHQINEDSAIDTFLGMCHALSEKISSKLTRVRSDSNFAKMQQLFSDLNNRS